MVLNWPIESVGTVGRNGSSGSPDIMGHRSVSLYEGWNGSPRELLQVSRMLSSGRINILVVRGQVNNVNNNETQLGGSGPMRRAVDEVVVAVLLVSSLRTSLSPRKRPARERMMAARI